MRHSVSHELDPDEARQVARRAVDSYLARFADYDAAARWIDSDHCRIAVRVQGLSLHGLIALLPHELSMDVDVPWSLSMFASRAVDVIDREARLWTSGPGVTAR